MTSFSTCATLAYIWSTVRRPLRSHWTRYAPWPLTTHLQSPGVLIIGPVNLLMWQSSHLVAKRRKRSLTSFFFCKRFPYCNLHLVIHLVTSLFLEHFNDNTSYHIRQRNIPKLFGFYRNCEIKDKERGKMRLVLKANMTVKYVYY